VVASKGGAEEHPAWYLNLSDQPEVTVQVRGDRFKARARTATAKEKPELWRMMTERWPAYEEYQRKTAREIPVVVLEREG
jgi:deazaflavin-dependent oxidoreductase (nitroreductase family)